MPRAVTAADAVLRRQFDGGAVSTYAAGGGPSGALAGIAALMTRILEDVRWAAKAEEGDEAEQVRRRLGRGGAGGAGDVAGAAGDGGGAGHARVLPRRGGADRAVPPGCGAQRKGDPQPEGRIKGSPWEGSKVQEGTMRRLKRNEKEKEEKPQDLAWE